MKKLISSIVVLFVIIPLWATEMVPTTNLPNVHLPRFSDQQLDDLVNRAEHLYPFDTHEQWYFIMVELESLKSEYEFDSRSRF